MGNMPAGNNVAVGGDTTARISLTTAERIKQWRKLLASEYDDIPTADIVINAALDALTASRSVAAMEVPHAGA